MIVSVCINTNKIILHLSTDPLCLLQEEQDQRASFYMIISVCNKKNKISKHLSTGSSLFLTRKTILACLSLQNTLWLVQEEQDQRVSFYMIVSVCNKKNKTTLHLSTYPLCMLKEELHQRASFYMIVSVYNKKNKISVHLSTWSSLFVSRRAI